MRLPLTAWIISALFAGLHGQPGEHCTLLSNVRIAERGSSIWGWTSPTGEEFALLGTELGLRIYSLKNPTDPEEVYFVKGTKNIWREIKTLDNFCYVVTEASDGLLIVDMSKAPNEFRHKFVKEFPDANGNIHTVHSAHTIFADEKNFLYLAGARPIGSGCVILDAGQDFWNPVYIHDINETYFHEVFVQNDILYGAEIFAGLLSIRNIKDRNSPQFLNDARTKKNFTHSVWKETSRNILYSADEVSGAPVEIWNIDDFRRLKKIGEWQIQKPWDQSSIPHNVFHKDGRLYVSHYTEGVRILDTQDPENLVEVAYYDTYHGVDVGFHGCWSIYPFFKNNVLIASDIEGGLFVFQYDGNEAAHVEIKLINKENREPVDNALVALISGRDTIEAYSNLHGQAKTGYRNHGTIHLRVVKFGYRTLDTFITLIKSQTNTHTFELDELPKFTLSVRTRDYESRKNIGRAHVKIQMGKVAYEKMTNNAGRAIFEDIYQGNWDIVAGKWGHRYAVVHDFVLEQPSELTLELSPGYQDDFVFDYGWTQETSTPNVRFKRGDFSELSPAPSNFPSKDVPYDIGRCAMYTNNFSISDPAWTLSGHLALVSPSMNLSLWSDLECSYSAWAYGGHDAWSVKKIFLRSGAQEIPLEEVPFNLQGVFNDSSKHAIVEPFEDQTDVRLVFYLENPPDTTFSHIALRAAFDAFKMEGKLKTKIGEANEEIKFRMQPNPVADFCRFENLSPWPISLRAINLSGYEALTMGVEAYTAAMLNTANWPSGIYLVRIEGKDFSANKFVVKH